MKGMDHVTTTAIVNDSRVSTQVHTGHLTKLQKVKVNKMIRQPIHIEFYKIEYIIQIKTRKIDTSYLIEYKTFRDW